ncbi:hypothetical protein FE257_003468 [Aspergillus nanangensis]|uniref:N-acetyltransferase domain-containing protein n=1 Tax=Aspergillus nanangensis TaxID=2582783 RepID=A0AAD4CCW0_ASPNN|nr:hypothetical protein FE257_003468 [Aspergillus nanangensis]
MIAADTSYTDNAALLPGDSPELTLLAASPKERVESIKLNSTAWKGPLDPDSYLAREDHLYRQPLTRDGLICWLLVDRREPEGQRTILSSCETYKKKAWLAHDGELSDTIAYGVGSVYCRPEFRGQGYAKRMLQELTIKMDEWQMEKAANRTLFSVLFSDIGKNFYAQFGWKPFPSSHFELPLISKDDYNQQIPGVSLPNTRDLAAADVQSYICSDTVLQKERDLLRTASQNSPSTKIAIAPSFDHYSWHWAREEFYAGKLCPGRTPPVIKGAGEDASGVYCAWNRNFGETPEENTLYILRWVYDDPTTAEETKATVNAMAAILRRAQLEAHEWNMSTIQFWNPTPLLEKAVALLDPSAKVVHREKTSIACLRWTGADHGLTKDVEWLLNEKYAWC